MKPRGLLTRFGALPVLWTTLLSGWAYAQDTAHRQWNLLLVSIDTLRADHLGAYGYHSVSPTIDRLAKEGTVFDEVFTAIPLTLPAHASLLASAYPPVTGVRDNGEVLPVSAPTLADQLRAHGFETGAFVASFVLDRRFGLARGFDEYWGEFPLYRFAGADPGTIQIRGDRVENAASDWISSHRSSRFFAFVHFYDLHGPFLLPADWRARFPGRIYDAELAYVDDLIRQLWETLLRQGLADRTLLVVTADHGEGLGDHGELNHGFLLYRSTTQVPLIIRFPDRRWAGKRVTTVARLIDVAPTVCTLLGVPPAPSFQGRSLAPEIAGQTRAPALAYSETLYPYRQFHSAPLYAIRSDAFTYIRAPRPELYDLRKDPDELHNLIQTHQSTVNTLRADLDQLSASMAHGSPPASPTPEVLEQLKSLGYVGTGSARNPPPLGDFSLPDPKDRLPLYRQLQRAREMESQGDIRTAVTQLEEIVRRDPALVVVQIEAGLALQHLDQHEAASKHFRAALRVDPQNALAHYDLGISLGNLRRVPEAAHEFEIATSLEPEYSRAFTALGASYAQMGEAPQAIATLDRALAIDPTDLEALLNRGNLYLQMREWKKSEADLRAAAALEPDNPEVHHALGTMEFYQGDMDAALKEYQRAIEIAPRSAALHADLGLLYTKLGRNSEAAAEFHRALQLDPNNQTAVEGLKAQ